MQNIEDYKNLSEKFRHETESVLKEKRDMETKLNEDKKLVQELSQVIPSEEKKLISDRQKLSKAKGEIPNLQSKVNEDTRKLARIQVELNQTAIKASQAMKGQLVDGKHLRELKEKRDPRY